MDDSFIAAPIMAALSQRTPPSAGASRGNRGAQDRDKRNSLYYEAEINRTAVGRGDVTLICAFSRDSPRSVRLRCVFRKSVRAFNTVAQRGR